MAKAKATRVTTVEEVTLVLTGKEAGLLRDILRRVGGPASGPRGEVDSIKEALVGVGIECYGASSDGAIYFT